VTDEMFEKDPTSTGATNRCDIQTSHWSVCEFSRQGNGFVSAK